MLRKYTQMLALLVAGSAVCSCGAGSLTPTPKEALGPLEEHYGISMAPVIGEDESVHIPQLSLRVHSDNNDVVCSVFIQEEGNYNYFACHLTYDARLLAPTVTEYADAFGSEDKVITLTISNREGPR
jgi:hypothetical protein